jgi:S-(hydroxymethyl)glutathione dehydrogenase/alcohol dehydrogenase
VNVVMSGPGGIGLNVIQGAKMVGADKIIGVDLNPGAQLSLLRSSARRTSLT